MPFSALTYRVLLASPSDVPDERAIIGEEIDSWNTRNSKYQKTVLQTVRWEKDSIPDLSGSPQSLINDRLVDSCDLLIGVFWTRIGTPTENEQSGTIEEIERFISSGKPVMLYFSDVSIPPSAVDTSQLTALRDTKSTFYNRGIVGKFSTHEELRSKFSENLAIKMNDLLSSKKDPIEGKPLISSGIDEVDISTYFKGTVYRDMNQALRMAHQFSKPIFMVIYDSKHSEQSRVDYNLKYFMQYDTTKNLVSTNFIQAFVDVNSEGVRSFLDRSDPLESFLLVILDSQGQVTESAHHGGNPQGSMEFVQALVSKFNNAAGTTNLDQYKGSLTLINSEMNFNEKILNRVNNLEIDPVSTESGRVIKLGKLEIAEWESNKATIASSLDRDLFDYLDDYYRKTKDVSSRFQTLSRPGTSFNFGVVREGQKNAEDLLALSAKIRTVLRDLLK